ncbi:MAG: NADH-quinone oxidoreductase subunit J [bacterium]
MLNDIIFLIFWFVIAIFAVLAVFLQKPIYNAFAMAFSIFSIAGMYIFLGYEFLAALQVLVYVGAISVAIIFVIMLSPPVTVSQKKINPYKIMIGVVTSLALFVLIFALYYGKYINEKINLALPSQGVKEIGNLLAKPYAVPFEIISVILLVAIMGAIVLAKKED